MCFRGTGLRIKADETNQYHPDVHVMWQPKAWYDSATCNKWVVQYAADEISKADLRHGQMHLLICDNLAGQTKRSNPKFSKLLKDLCNAEVWNLLAGNTDEIQVVDAGFGALMKRLAEGVQQDWFQDDQNWAEWTGPTMSASRRRILATHWYGAAYEQACQRFDFCKVFDSTGSNLTALGSRDHLIKLQGLVNFSFTVEDAKRDAMSGEMNQGELPAAAAEEEANAIAGSSDNEEQEELSENDGSDSGSGGETDCEGEPYDCPDGWTIVDECPEDSDSTRRGLVLAHRWEEGWYSGEIKWKVELSDNPNMNGKYACQYSDRRRPVYHDLFTEDYGPQKMWVVIKKS